MSEMTHSLSGPSPRGEFYRSSAPFLRRRSKQMDPSEMPVIRQNLFGCLDQTSRRLLHSGIPSAADQEQIDRVLNSVRHNRHSKVSSGTQIYDAKQSSH